jgi:hypothetical protein
VHQERSCTDAQPPPSGSHIIAPYRGRAAFRRAVQEGKALGVMCSYNAVNDITTPLVPSLTS